jgi:general secretion pathway protein D
MPVLGRLFSATRDNVAKTEIVLLITPRLVRTLARPEARLVEFAAGTEASTGSPAGSVPPPAFLPPKPAVVSPQVVPQPGISQLDSAPASPAGPVMVPFGGVKPAPTE